MKTVNRWGDRLMARLVPQTTAEAGAPCYIQHVCKGHLIPNRCNNQLDRYRQQRCYRNNRWEILSDTFVGCCLY